VQRLQPSIILPRWLRLALTLLLIASLGLALWFGFFAVAELPRANMFYLRNDNAEHILAFADLAFLSLLLWRPAWLVVAVLIALAALLELAQTRSAIHEAHLSDFLFSSLGVVLGAALFAILALAIGSWRRAPNARHLTHRPDW
jgi:hypothetical protein